MTGAVKRKSDVVAIAMYDVIWLLAFVARRCYQSEFSGRVFAFSALMPKKRQSSYCHLGKRKRKRVRSAFE